MLYWMLQQHAARQESLGEELLEWDMRTFAPAPVLPIYQAIEKLEESPNLTPQERQGLEWGEIILIGITAYFTYQGLRNYAG